MEDLTIRHAEGNRDYIYYLAIGNARLKNYSMALKYLRAFLQVEPNNMQVITLEVRCGLFFGIHKPFPIKNFSRFQEAIKKKMDRESMIGVAVASGAALVLGGIVGIGMALAKK